MASTFTTRLGLEKITTGEKENTWGGLEQANQDLLDQFIAGVGSVAAGGSIDVTLIKSQWADSIIVFTGVLLASISIIMPTIEKRWLVKNAMTGSFTLTFKRLSGSGVVVTQGAWAEIYGDGTDMQLAVEHLRGVTDLVVADGGTGVSTLTANGVVIGQGTSPVTVTAVGTAGQLLQSAGAGNDPTFEDAGFASGTIMLFGSAAAPTGWTKSSSFDNHALRVVNGTPSSAGATDFDSVFGAAKMAGSHVLITAEMPAHTHDVKVNDGGAGPDQINLPASTATTSNIVDAAVTKGGGGAHNNMQPTVFENWIIKL